MAGVNFWYKWPLPPLNKPLTAGQITDHWALTTLHHPNTHTHIHSRTHQLFLFSFFKSPSPPHPHTHGRWALHPLSWPLIWLNWVWLFPLSLSRSVFLVLFALRAWLLPPLWRAALNRFTNKQPRIWVSCRYSTLADQRSDQFSADEQPWRHSKSKNTYEHGSCQKTFTQLQGLYCNLLRQIPNVKMSVCAASNQCMLEIDLAKYSCEIHDLHDWNRPHLQNNSIVCSNAEKQHVFLTSSILWWCNSWAFSHRSTGRSSLRS